MTNKEAIIMLEQLKETIKILEQLKDKLNYEVSDSQKKIDALNMAIKTLEQTQFADGDRAVSLNNVIATIYNSSGNFKNNFDQGYFADKIRELPSVILQPCEDAISRQVIIDMLNDIDAEVNDGCGYMYEHWMDYIKQLPGVTPERPTGHWIVDVDKWGDIVTTVNGYRCDKCNTFNTDKDNYCPNCGARMDGDTE